MHLYRLMNRHYSTVFLIRAFCFFSDAVLTCFVLGLWLFILILVPFATQGAKESNPTFSMTLVEEGHYAVDFHAQLSTLQAFSICVAILHGTSTSSGAGHEKNQQLTQCSSLKMLIEEEVELLIKSVTTEERKTVSKTRKRFPQSYMLNPPFSPIARV